MNPGKHLNGLVNVGFYNFVVSDHIIAILDTNSSPARKLIESIKKEKPRNLINTCKGRKALCVIILTGDRYVLSAIPRTTIAERLSVQEEDERVKLNKKIYRQYKKGQVKGSKVENLDIDEILKTSGNWDEDEDSQEPDN